MSIFTRLFGGQTVSVTPTSMADAFRDRPSEYYDLLRAYYLNNGLYDQLKAALYTVGMSDEALKPLRNPAHRVVEFYAAKLWPGTLPDALPIVTKNQSIIAPIEQIWSWSNWASQKQVAARWQALFGNVFVKAATRQDAAGKVIRVFLQLIEPVYVPEFETDERGYLTYCRFDLPIEERVGDQTKTLTHTEIWDKATNSYRVWRHEKTPGTPVDQLGTPVDQRLITDFGFDFIPVVHIKFRDLGDKRGTGAFETSLDKIDEANRLATRLHRMLFKHNKALWALEGNGLDAGGRPIPPPRLATKDADGGTRGTASSDTLEVGDDSVVRLPSGWILKSLVPDIRYADALEILRDHMQELERDLPELMYFRLSDVNELSGKAIRLLLSDAVDHLLEARANAEAGLVRAQQMALTMGTVASLWSVGSYEAGAFEHSFAERQVFPATDDERAMIMQNYVTAGLAKATAMRLAGFSEPEIKQAQDEFKAEQTAQAELATAYLEQARREFDQGPNRE